MNQVTLTSIFEANKAALAEKLQGSVLPQDAQKVQKIVSDYLNGLFDSESDYRQNLTQSEDYILLAAIQLLQTQQNITAEIASSTKGTRTTEEKVAPKDNKSYIPLVGTGVGALAGGFLGIWGAFCGAVAGTAIVIYCANKEKGEPQKVAKPVASIDVTIFTSIVEKICQSIDELMETYRVQVKRIENVYANKENVPFQVENATLLSLIGNVHKSVMQAKENVPANIVSEVEMLARSLNTYDLAIENGKVVSTKN